jgi:5-methyltetrahydropteroyltriglutamate--homocysteine methyltransferase
MTMVDTLYDDYYKSREKLAEKFADVLNIYRIELEESFKVLIIKLAL